MLTYGAAILAYGAALAAAVTKPITLNLTGHINPDQVMTFVYQPFKVPAGVTSISVAYNYTLKGQGNALDIGIFDQRGYANPATQNGTLTSRGWSGGFRTNFTLANTWGTPGYNPGSIDPGMWNIVFGPYSSTDAGIDWTLNIRLAFDKSDPKDWYKPDYAAISQEPSPWWKVSEQLKQPQWYRGDFHLHSVHSDGRYLPQEQVANAVARKLDFMFFSEHNTNSGIDVYGLYQPTDRDFLIGRAIEVTTRHGHWQAIGIERGQKIDWRYHPEDGEQGYPAAAEEVHRVGGLVSVNHPFALCGRCSWALDWNHNDAIEIWNGPWDPTDQLSVQKWQSFLVQGRRYIGIGGSDAHSSPDVTALPTTVVLADALTQDSIVQGVRNGYAYMVRDGYDPGPDGQGHRRIYIPFGPGHGSQ